MRSSSSRGWALYGGMCLLSAAGMFLPRLYDSAGEGLVLYAAHPCVLVLPMCLIGPCLCSRMGVPPIVSFFPPGLCFLLSPDYPGMAGWALLFLFLSLVSAEAGREWAARRRGSEQQKNEKGFRKGGQRGNGKKQKR